MSWRTFAHKNTCENIFVQGLKTAEESQKLRRHIEMHKPWNQVEPFTVNQTEGVQQSGISSAKTCN